MGCAEIETRVSIAWVSASSPVCAVTLGGSVLVSSGSTIASVGAKYRLTKGTFWWRSGTVTIAMNVTSLPVPAVVGMATSGPQGPGTASLPS